MIKFREMMFGKMEVALHYWTFFLELHLFFSRSS